jgi:hypothetical protein
MSCCHVFYQQISLYTRLVGPVRTGTENVVPIGIRSRTIQTVASRYHSLRYTGA